MKYPRTRRENNKFKRIVNAFLFHYSCGSVVVDTELLFGSDSDVNEAMVNTILEQSADEFLTYNLTLLDPGLVESTYVRVFVMSRQLSSSLTFSLEFEFRPVLIYLQLLVYNVYYLCKFSLRNLDQWL